jgi:hypothetical protein
MSNTAAQEEIKPEEQAALDDAKVRLLSPRPALSVSCCVFHS